MENAGIRELAWKGTEQSVSNLPKIEYGKSISDPECPYKVDVDAVGCSKLLELAGVNKDKLKDITVEFHRKQNRFDVFNQVLGDYDYKKKKIRIYTDFCWKEQEKVIKRADKILKRVENNRVKDSATGNKNSFPELASGKRLSWYLTVAPPERARKMVEKLAAISASKKVDVILSHEAKHAGDHETEGKWFYLKNMSIAGAMGGVSTLGASFLLKCVNPNADLMIRSAGAVIVGVVIGQTLHYWFLGPVERSARKFENEYQNLSESKLITLVPKH
jgi:hypothetical protein